MTKRAYFYQTNPLDPDHSAIYYFEQGVVELEPDEVDRLEAELRAIGHSGVVLLRPVDEVILDAEAFRALIGSAIRHTHDNEYFREVAHAGDRPFLEAAAAREEDTDTREALLALARGEKAKREWDDYGEDAGEPSSTEYEWSTT